MEIAIHSKESVLLKVSKEIYHFSRNSQLTSDVKNDSTGLPQSESDKKSDSDTYS